MENKRILNRIIFINIANTDYASVEIAGNTCFVGTNNMGKTTLQRAILFFYNADTRHLGISTSQKTFEEYYFQFPNSYIIYEVATEEGLFHVMVYRNTKIFYRFVNAAFEKDQYINNKEVLQPKHMLGRLNDRKIDYSDQIETFERYRNIIYGADPDKRYKKYALMKGNANYHNIPLAITSIFLSSESVIRAEFVKECIANAIGSKHTTIELKTIERQLRQFTERYQDIETFFRKDSTQRGELIRDNFAKIRQVKVRQRTLAGDLGGAVKYAEIQKVEINTKVDEKRLLLSDYDADFKTKEEQYREKNRETNQTIGEVRAKLREADKRALAYDELGIADLLREAEDKPRLQVDVQARESEYQTLTTAFSDVEQKFKILFDALENERKEFETILRGQGLTLDQKFHDEKRQLVEEFSKEKDQLKREANRKIDAWKDQRSTLSLKLQEAEFKEKQYRQHVYFGTEVETLTAHVSRIGKEKPEFGSQLTVKNGEVETLKKDAERTVERNQLALEQLAKDNQTEVHRHEEAVRKIDERLADHQTAFFGYLQENHPGWYETIGKVCNEDILFNKELNPQLLKKGVDSLYGIQLDLSQVKVFSKSLEQYEQERVDLRDKISTLHQQFLEFRELQAREEQANLATISKKIAQLKNEITQRQYDLDQLERKGVEHELDLLELKRKGEAQREKDMVAIYGVQESIKKEIEDIKQHLALHDQELNKDLAGREAIHIQKVVKLKKQFDAEAAKIKGQKEDKVEDIEDRKAKLQKEKSTTLKKKGFDDTRLNALKKEINDLKKALADIETNAQVVSEYLKDKRELFDQVPDFTRDKIRLEEQIKQAEKEFTEEKVTFNSKRDLVDTELRQYLTELNEYTIGLQHYENHFQDKILYDRLRHIIDAAPSGRSEFGIVALCSQLHANDNEYHNQFGKFREYISEFAGRFRADNHFNFRMDSVGGDPEYERFASYLEEFYNENKIKTSIAEVAKSHGMLIDAIASKMRTLNEYRGRITKMINKMEGDFSKASFDSSQLIEYIKLKAEESENKVLRKLQRITEFREENPLLYGDTNLFTVSAKGKGEIDKKSVDLLNDLQKTISEEKYEEINVQDLFELRFRIKEGKNDTGWIEKIDKVGSNGTDMLVKAVIYITLLNVFIKESTERAARNFKVHCIIDEVGQISAPYLKELIAFADERDICLVNGLPNESKLETHYNFTYKFRKDSNGFVKVIPLLTMNVEP